MNHYNIVILNWNGWSDTINCLKSIEKNSVHHNYTIYLVDNGSKDSEIEEIENYIKANFQEYLIGDKEFFLETIGKNRQVYIEPKNPPKIVLIKNNENLGFAKGNNIALKYLKDKGESLVILLNNDTEILDDALNKLVDFYNQKSQIGAVVPQIRYYDPNDIIWNCGGMINSIGVRKYDYAFSKIDNVPQIGYKKIDYGTGCTLLFDIQKVGLLTEKFFFGEEDMEFAFRLKKMQLSTFCLYESVILHKVGASRDQISKNSVGKMVYHYCQRMSNLRDNLSVFYYYVSLFAHMLSSLRLLKKAGSLKISTFLNCWKVVLSNVNNKRFTLSDFKYISNKNY